MKIYCMSDIHGHLQEFEDALSKIDLTGDVKLLLLGDYIHGPDSYGALDKIIGLQESGTILVLMYDTEKGKFYRVTDGGAWLILPYNEEN